MLTTSIILNSESAWVDCIYTGNESNWLETLVNCITSGSPLVKQNQGTEKIPSVETESQEATIFKELQHKKVFIDAANEDATMLSTFKVELNSKGIKSIALNPQNNPTEMFNQLESALDACDVVVTFYNEAPLSWLTQRLRHYQKAQSKRKNNLIIHIRSSKPQPKDLNRLPPNAHWENWGLAT